MEGVENSSGRTGRKKRITKRWIQGPRSCQKLHFNQAPFTSDPEKPLNLMTCFSSPLLERESARFQKKQGRLSGVETRR